MPKVTFVFQFNFQLRESKKCADGQMFGNADINSENSSSNRILKRFMCNILQNSTFENIVSVLLKTIMSELMLKTISSWINKFKPIDYSISIKNYLLIVVPVVIVRVFVRFNFLSLIRYNF